MPRRRRRIGRIVLNALTALSLLTSAGTAALLVIMLGFQVFGQPTQRCVEALFVVVFLVAFVLMLMSYRRAVRPPTPRDPTVCAVCRYDLTGNVSGTCPECGTPVAAAAEDAAAAAGGGLKPAA